MAIRISIYALDSDDERIADVTLPANKHTIIDALDRKAYAEEFHARILPPNLDKNVFSVSCTDKLGEMILAECNCKYTDYGIISEYGGSLFPIDETPQQEQNSDFKMGGIS